MCVTVLLRLLVILEDLGFDLVVIVTDAVAGVI